jgi:ankyrin repeat protein
MIRLLPPDVFDKEKRAALREAAASNQGKLVDVFLDDPTLPSIGNDALVAASLGGHVEVVEKILGAGVKVDVPGSHEVDNLIALSAAAQGGHVEAVKALLRAGADVDGLSFRRPGEGISALQIAASRGAVEIMTTLIAANANVNIITANAHTPMGYAVLAPHREAIEILLRAKAEANTAHSTALFTPLQMATSAGDVELVGKLLAAGADPDFVTANKFCLPPLVQAAQDGHLAIVEMLLAAHANVNVINPDRRDYTALKAAIVGNQTEVIQVLRQAGARN